MNWDDLRVLAALEREGSLAGAARRLGVNHSTVSRRIAALEEQLGHNLIRRLARSTPLTDKGREIAALAKEMELSAQKVRRASQAAEGTLSGTVRLSAPPALVSEIIIPALAALGSTHPELRVLLSADSQIASLDRGDADLAVRMVEPQGQQNIFRRIGRIDFALYANAEVAKKPVQEWRFIAFDDTLAHVPQQRWLDTFAGDRPTVFMTGDFHSQCAAAAAGIGVALLPCVMADAKPTLQRVSMDQPEGRPIWLVIHSDLRDAPAVRAIANGLIEAFANI